MRTEKKASQDEGSGFALTYLSLGAGVQSSALLVCSALGLHGVPKADVAIFADTGDEPQYVYDWLAKLEVWSSAHGVQVRRVGRGRTLGDAVLHGSPTRTGRQRYITLPVFTKNPGLRSAGKLPRHCTQEFKIEPLTATVRELVGLKPGERAVTKRRAVKVRAMLGISIDEAIRMNHSDGYWREMKEEQPAEFAKATAFDAAIRAPRAGRKQDAYLHRSLEPLATVDFYAQREFDGDGFGNECEGMCGV